MSYQHWYRSITESASNGCLGRQPTTDSRHDSLLAWWPAVDLYCRHGGLLDYTGKSAPIVDVPGSCMVLVLHDHDHCKSAALMEVTGLVVNYRGSHPSELEGAGMVSGSPHFLASVLEWRPHTGLLCSFKAGGVLIVFSIPRVILDSHVPEWCPVHAAARAAYYATMAGTGMMQGASS